MKEHQVMLKIVLCRGRKKLSARNTAPDKRTGVLLSISYALIHFDIIGHA